jgi:hypothetical protein
MGRGLPYILIRGPRGPAGATGPVGPRGPRGVTGPTGPMGSTNVEAPDPSTLYVTLDDTPQSVMGVKTFMETLALDDSATLQFGSSTLVTTYSGSVGSDGGTLYILGPAMRPLFADEPVGSAPPVQNLAFRITAEVVLCNALLGVTVLRFDFVYDGYKPTALEPIVVCGGYPGVYEPFINSFTPAPPYAGPPTKINICIRVTAGATASSNFTSKVTYASVPFIAHPHNSS